MRGGFWAVSTFNAETYRFAYPSESSFDWLAATPMACQNNLGFSTIKG
jgi:hypothetical protein